MPPAKVVLITGASSGLGRAAAEALARRGYRVFGTSRRPSDDPRPYEMLRLDVRRDESVAACVQDVVRRAGRIDVLVNNAGYGLKGMIEEASGDQVRDQFETNFMGAVRMVQAVLPIMRGQRQGRIINVSSVAGRMGLPGEAFYCASKFALEGFTESLAFEVERFGIRVCVVEPGAFRTEIVPHSVEAGRQLAEYDPIRRAAHTSLLIAMRTAAAPEVFARHLLRIIESRRPGLRHPVGPGAGWILRGKALLPAGMFRRILKVWFYVNRWRLKAYLQRARQAEAQATEVDRAH